jgi:uncharacterized membrane protein
MINTRTGTQKVVFGGLMAALIFAATCLSFPNGVGGYTHLGDAMIVVTVMFLGSRVGAVSAGIGAMLADIILGYGMWAPFSFAAKFVMVLVIGIFLAVPVLKGRLGWFIAVFAGCISETVIYATAGYFLEGGIGAAIAEASGMVIQCVLGIVIGFILTEALAKSPLGRQMTYTTTRHASAKGSQIA